MSSRIIKSYATRLLPAESRLRNETDDNNAAEANLYEDTLESAEEEAARLAQAAYDETIEAAEQEAAAILRDAHKEAVEIVEFANAEAVKIREKAYEDGLEGGHSAGYDDFFKSARDALLEIMDDGQAEVERTIAEVYTERDRLLDEMEPRILSLALDVGKKILGYELDENKEAFLSIVKTALNVIKCEGRVTLRINAEQHIEAFLSKARTQLRTERGMVEADIVADLSVDPGGCVIETGSGTVDASVDAQLEQISRNLGF